MKEADEQKKTLKKTGKIVLHAAKFLLILACSAVMAVFLQGWGPKHLEIGEAVECHTLDSLSKESQELFRRVLFGNYSVIKGADKKGFSLVSKAENLWSGTCTFMDIDRDGQDECFLYAVESGKSYYYILKVEQGQIIILDKICRDCYAQVLIGIDGTMLLIEEDGTAFWCGWDSFWKCMKIESVNFKEARTKIGKIVKYCVTEKSWQKVSESLGEEFKVYLRSYKFDNRISQRYSDQIFYSNREDHYYLYCRSWDPWRVLEKAVYNVYAESEWVYFTERNEEHGLWRYGVAKENKGQTDKLTDFSVENLLKINDKFYFLSYNGPEIENPNVEKKYLYSMNINGSNVQRLAEDVCVSYESDGVVLFAAFETGTEKETIVKELNLQGQVLDENSAGMFPRAQQMEWWNTGQTDLRDCASLLGAEAAFDRLPKEEQKLYQEVFSGNYRHIQGSEETEFVFVKSALDLWSGKCLVLDINEDGRWECCLKTGEEGDETYYILNCEKDEIVLGGTYSRQTFEEEILGEDTYLVTLAKDINWQPVLPLLDAEFKTYFMNFAEGNVIGGLGEKIYWSIPQRAYSLYETDSEDISWCVLEEPVRSIYVEEDVIYYINRMNSKLYRMETPDGGWNIRCLTDFPVEKLLKIQGEFYFLSEGFLYSMTPSGVIVKKLSNLECVDYFSDGLYLYGTFVEKGKKVQKELDLQGNVIAGGFPDLPVMAERGDVYVAGNTILTQEQKEKFLFDKDFSTAAYEDREVFWLNIKNFPDEENLSRFVKKELTAQGITKAGVSYTISVPQFNGKIAGYKKINEVLQQKLEEAVQCLEKRDVTEQELQIEYEWDYLYSYWVSVSFRDKNTKTNCCEFLPPLNFVAETGEKVELAELIPAELLYGKNLTWTTYEEYLKDMICAIQLHTDFRWTMEQMAEQYQNDYYLSKDGVVLCYRPGTLEQSLDWQEFLIPYESMREYSVCVDRDWYGYTTQEERDAEKFAVIGTELSYQYRKHHNKTLVLGAGWLDKVEYFERPAIEGKSEAANRINAVFDSEEEAFILEAREGSLTEYCIDQLNWLEEGTNPVAYEYSRNASVSYNKNRIFSVVIDYDWYAGGVVDYGWDTYNFYTDTGERFYLDDVLADDIDTVRQIISDAFLEEMEWEPSISHYSFKDFDFAMEEEELAIFFDKYEVGCGADGGQIIHIPYAQLHIREDFPLYKLE